MKERFSIRECSKEIIEVLKKHNATISDMKEVFKRVKQEVISKTPIHTESNCKSMLFTPTDSSGTKYSPESIGIPCPVIDRE